MATSNPKQGIIQYWPQILGIASLVFGAGVTYGKFGQMDERQKSIEARQDRQFEDKVSLEKRVIELEKRTEYYKGLRDGRNEAQGKKTTE
jgi:hypothetical protein